jgi:hypothetical protein
MPGNQPPAQRAGARSSPQRRPDEGEDSPPECAGGDDEIAVGSGNPSPSRHGWGCVPRAAPPAANPCRFGGAAEVLRGVAELAASRMTMLAFTHDPASLGPWHTRSNFMALTRWRDCFRLRR